ncbi:MAG: hypothetical protein WBE72_18115 [Terracidiphilus sp.]
MRRSNRIHALAQLHIQRNAVKASNRICIRVKCSEKAIGAYGFEHRFNFRRCSCKPDIAVALQSLLETSQQQMNCTLVDLAEPGAIENEARANGIHACIEIQPKRSLLTGAERLGNLFYYHRTRSACHIAAPP